MGVNNMDDVDEYLEDAIAFVVESGQASASLMQRRFRVGYNRAARLVDSMEERGIIGPSRGSKPREVLLSSDELRALSGLEAFEMEYSSEDNDPESDHEDY
jgi:S-DNA-T family DNA segregation ATPase FtsK/SpoIIIE